jgi:hypothetical protein
MTHNATRAFVAFVAFAAAVFAGYDAWTLDRRETAALQGARSFDARIAEALLITERLRSAQQSYVAEGQGSEFWISRADESFARLDRAVTALAGAAINAELRDGVRNAAAAFEDVRRIDGRARQWVRSNQRLMASDLIFTENLAASATFIERLAGLRDGQRDAVETQLASIKQRQFYAMTGSAAVVLIAVLLLTPAVRPLRPEDTREALRVLIAKNSPPLLRAEPAPRATTSQISPISESAVADASATAADSSDVTRRPSSTQTEASPVRQRTLDIEAAAGVCSELARVLDPADLPALLARAAGVIGARGLIVWVADTAGSMLFPTLSVGYTPGALERMGGIRRDADNAAAAAYRHGDVQVVPARNGGPGAIVAPIVATDGCVGVLAAEVATGDEDEMDRRAVASILAAQLATIVTAVPEERQALRSMDSGWAAG